MKQERLEGGDLPNGGAYAIAYYQDADGTPVEKEQAVRVEVFEYDENDKPISYTVIEV